MSTRRMIRAAVSGLVALVAACGGAADPADPPGPDGSLVRDGVAYSADLRVMESFPVQLRGSLRMENVGAAPTRLELATGCPVLLRAYRPGAARPAWDQGRQVVCTMQIQVLDLAPGEASEEDAPATDAAQILGDSLPDGSYRLTTYVRVDGGAVEVPVGTVELASPF